MFNLFPLYPGDDIEYISDTDEASYGRIRSINGSICSVTRFEMYHLPTPPPPSSCMPLCELYLTSNIDEDIPLADIQDIIFVISSDDASNLVLSLSGIENVYYIRFESTGDAFSPLTNWRSFNAYSIPSLIYSSILRIQETIVKLLNISRISVDTSATESLYVPLVAFDYLRLKVSESEHINYTISHSRKRTKRGMGHDYSKIRKQNQVSIETLEADGALGIEFLVGLFGILIKIGTSTPPAKLGSTPESIKEGTRLHIARLTIHRLIESSYDHVYVCLFPIQCRNY